VSKLSRLALALVSLFWLTGATWLPLFKNAGGSPSYTFIADIGSNATGATFSHSYALGSNPTCVVVVGITTQYGISVAPVIGGVTLTQADTDSSTGNGYTGYIYYGTLSSCTGSQTLSFTTSSSFTYRGATVWVLTNLASSTPVQTVTYHENSGTRTPSSPTISVTAGDLLFANGNGGTGTSGTCSGSSVAATANRTGGISSEVSADWLIASTNASFLLNCDSTNNSNVVVAASFH
jgi:hypothetical protein